jgi:hypothetical protein
MHIIDSSNPLNELITNQEVFVGVTAVDSNGNEINNEHELEKFTNGKNLVSIIVKDLLEIGFIKINNYNPVGLDNKLVISWEEPTIYIDGSPITDINILNSIAYNVRLADYVECSNEEIFYDISGIEILGSYQYAGENYIDTSSLSIGSYCEAITATKYGEIEYGKAFMTTATIIQNPSP